MSSHSHVNDRGPRSPGRWSRRRRWAGRYRRQSRSASEDDFEDRRRMQQNLAAFLLVVVLLVVGAWMIERLKAYSRTLACLEAGHRYCTVLDPRHLPARRGKRV